MKRVPTYDEIALRAYFIALSRHSRGEHRDALEDWLEAERQLKAELNAPTPTRPDSTLLICSVVIACGLALTVASCVWRLRTRGI